MPLPRKQSKIEVPYGRSGSEWASAWLSPVVSGLADRRFFITRNEAFRPCAPTQNSAWRGSSRTCEKGVPLCNIVRPYPIDEFVYAYYTSSLRITSRSSASGCLYRLYIAISYAFGTGVSNFNLEAKLRLHRLTCLIFLNLSSVRMAANCRAYRM